MEYKHKVLTVDNSPVILKIVSNILEKAGCEVQTASDGLEALDLLRTFNPDIIFTDLVMPNIDGAKLSHIIRNTPSYKDLFLVVLSGIALEDDTNILELGADVCIAKGPASTMQEHILAALDQFETGRRGSSTVQGLQGLYPREVTSELLVNKRHSEVIIEQMTEGVVEFDDQGRIVRANSTCCTLFNLTEARILGTDFTSLLPEDNKREVRQWLNSLPHSNKKHSLVFAYDKPIILHGRQLTFNLTPLFEQDKPFVIGLIKDVTTRKEMDVQRQQLEKELQRAHKFDAMATMASGIAHDFNNLLTIINGNIEMARVLSTDEQINTLLKETNKALGLTTGLIRQFSTFSDNYLPSKSRVCVDELLTDVLKNQLTDTGVSFEVTTGPGVECVDLDPDLMTQVFYNIILNAVESIDDKGTLQVQLDLVDGLTEMKKHDPLMSDGKYIRIIFKDSGSGIEPDILDQVFDPYFSTKQRGTQKGMGLGLTIVHAIVKKHGGTVKLESNTETGTTVYVYLPHEERKTREQHAARCQILIVDDDEMMRTITSRMFEQYNCLVTAVETGEDAIRKCTENGGDNTHYDQVLVELNPENGQNGVDIAKEIHKRIPQATLIAMSDNNKSEVMLHYDKYHFTAAIVKPFSIDTIEGLLNIYARQATG